jgi:tetratricopeptide (TPR) repeat protein
MELIFARLNSRLAWLQALARRMDTDIEAKLVNSLTTAQKIGDRSEIAFCHLQLGCYRHLIQRDAENALKSLEQSLSDYQSLEDTFYTAVVLHWLGSCHVLATDLDSFIFYTRQSLELAHETGNQVLIPYNLRSLTLGTLCSGDYVAAQNYCQEALVIDHQMGLYMGLAESKSILGLIHALRGDLKSGLPLAEEGLSIARKVGFPATIAHAQSILGLLVTINGDSAEGQRLGEQSLTTSLTLFGKNLAHWGLALAKYEQGNYTDVWDHIHAAMTTARQLSSPAMMAWLVPVAAALLARQGQNTSAVELLSSLDDQFYRYTGWTANWKGISNLRTCLATDMSPEDFEAAKSRGKRLDLITVSDRILERDSQRIPV